MTPNNERKSCLKVCEVSISASGKNSPVIDQNCHTLPLKQVDDCDVTIGNLNCDFVNDKQEKNVTDARDLSTTDYCDSFKDASGSNESDVSFFNRIGNEMQLETNAPYHFEKCECPLKLPVVEVEKLTTRDIEKVKSLLQNIRNDSTASSKDVECDPSGISSPLTAEIDSCPLNPNNDDFDEVESRMAIHSRSQDFNDSVTNNNGPELLKDINSSLYSDYPKNNPVIVKDFQSKQTIVLPIDKISTLTESESQGTSYCLEAVPSNPLNDSSNTNNQINPRRGNYCNGNCGKLVTSSSKRCLCFLGDSYSRRHLSPAKRVDCRNEVEVVTSTINGHQSFEDESVQVNDHGNMLRHQQDELLYSSVKGPSNLLESPFERNALSNSVICETNNSSNEKRPGTGSSSETDSDTSELSIEAGSGANNSYSDSVTNIPSLHFTTTNISSIDSFTEVNDSSFESVESSENDGVNHINDLIFNSVCDITSTTKQHPNILKESEFLLCNEHKNPVVFSQDESLDERSQPCHSQESNGIAISQSPKPPVQEVIVIESDSDISINEKSTVKTRSAAKKTNQTRGAQMLKLSKNISCTKNDVNLSMIAEKNCSDFVEPLESVGLRASDELMNNSIQKELSPALSKSPSIGKPSNKDERFLPTPLSSRCSPLASPLCQSPCSPSGILKRKTLMSDALTPTTPNKVTITL